MNNIKANSTKLINLTLFVGWSVPYKRNQEDLPQYVIWQGSTDLSAKNQKQKIKRVSIVLYIFRKTKQNKIQQDERKEQWRN